MNTPNPLLVESGLHSLTLPTAKHLLEEINLPPSLAESLAGKSVRIEMLQGPDGSETRVQFTDNGNRWFLPRRWVFPVSEEPALGLTYWVHRTTEFSEVMVLPPYEDLIEINLPHPVAISFSMRPAQVLVRVFPGQPAHVLLRNSKGETWRLPHDWRRRRIVLPSAEVLMDQGVPLDVAENFGQTITTVNYHPGSRCCLPAQYRFRDNEGGKWPVFIRNCTVIGFGDEVEHLA